VRTDEDTIGLVRRLAQHHDDATIAGILNKQERTTARGLRFTQNLVGNLRRHWNIPRCAVPAEPLSGELMSVRQAARELAWPRRPSTAGSMTASSPASNSHPAHHGAYA
jgi:hypothetical protein